MNKNVNNLKNFETKNNNNYNNGLVSVIQITFLGNENRVSKNSNLP